MAVKFVGILAGKYHVYEDADLNDPPIKSDDPTTIEINIHAEWHGVESLISRDEFSRIVQRNRDGSNLQ
jgi:hypothetical protein